MSEALVQHELTPDGESTAKWAMSEPGFLGSVRQLVHCARCGRPEQKKHDQPRKYCDAGKPTFHMICDKCHSELPD